MRRIRLTTTRWRSLSALRQDGFRDMLGRKSMAKVLGPDFVKGIEARRDTLESRQLTMWAWQFPVLLLLALSLLNLDLTAAVFGISIKSLKSAREVLLLLSAGLAALSLPVQWSISALNEMLEAVASKEADGDEELKAFLDVRYGVSAFLRPLPPNELMPSWSPIVLLILAVIGILIFMLALLGISLAIHVANLIEVYRHPNFSPIVSWLVISFVVIGDVAILSWWLLEHAVQPWQTYEDFRKLERMRKIDRAAAEKIIKEAFAKHRAKGPLRRLLGRPQIPKLP